MPAPSPMKAFRRLSLPLLLLALMAGCAVTPTRTGPAAETAQAQQLEQQGQYAGAAQIYEHLAAGAQGQSRSEYLVSAAEDWWRAQNSRRAWALLGELQPATLYPALAARTEILKADLDFAAHQPEAALKHLQFPLAPLPDTLKAQALLLRAQIEASLKNMAAAVEDLSERENYLENNAVALHDNHQRIWQLLNQPQVTANLAQLPANISPAARGWLALGNIARSVWQQPQQFLQQLEAWQTQYPGHPANQDIVPDLIAKQKALVTYPPRIAVLLPLTAPAYQSAADAIRDGLMTAYFQLAKNGTAPVIAFYDAGGAAAAAQGAYRQAVAAGADFVIGPLTKDAVGGIAALGSLKVPVLALNTLDSKSTIPAGLYQFGLPPEDEAAQVADRVIARNLVRGVTLVPQGDWGTRVLNAFTARFTQLGGSVLGSQTYAPGAGDYSVSITRLLNIDQSQYREGQLEGLLGTRLQFEPRRRQDIQFIFLAARASDAKLIRPQLKFFHAIDVPVYATSQVYDPSEQPDSDLDGISFDDMPWTLEPSGAAADTRTQVSQLWPANFGGSSRLYALGFDAWRLVPLLYQGKYLNAAVPGMTGLLTMSPDGRIHRQLDWARFNNGVPNLLAPLNTAIPVVAAPITPPSP